MIRAAIRWFLGQSVHSGGVEGGVRDDIEMQNYRTKELYFQIRTGCDLRQVERLIL